MAFTFAAFSYICALVLDAFLIFFSIFHVSIHLKFYRHFMSDRSVRRVFSLFFLIIIKLRIFLFGVSIVADYRF